MLVTLLGISIFTKLLHPENAPLPILVTLLGISILSKLLQYLNDSIPILVTLLGISILSKLLQYINAFSPIFVIPFSIMTIFIKLVYCELCQSNISSYFHFFISPLPEILRILSDKINLAITLPS